MVLVGLGFYLLPKENMRGFSETLLGLGLASAIMITYAGSVYFDLWDNYVSLALASLILLINPNGRLLLIAFILTAKIIINQNDKPNST